MIADGCLEGVDEVYGLHNTPIFPEGEIHIRDGPIYAAYSDINVTIKGKGGHSSMPHMCNDVITAGCNLIHALNNIKPSHVDSRENFVLTITTFNGGNANNVMADCATLSGSMRGFNNDLIKRVQGLITEYSHSIASINGCTAEVTFEGFNPAIINPAKET